MQKDKRCILLIEDVQAHAELFVLAAEPLDPQVEVDVVDSGQSAMETLKAIARGDLPIPDLVVLDLNLPMVSGHELLSYIRSTPAIRELPVVITTCSAAPSDIHRATSLGISTYLTKPIDTEDIRDAFGRVFSDSGSAG